VQRRRVGSLVRKALLVLLADVAREDGSGVWRSKRNLAAMLEAGRRTVQENLEGLESAGLIVATGRRRCARGYTVEYRLDLDAIARLPAISLEDDRLVAARAEGDGVREAHPSTGAGGAHVREPHAKGAGRAPEGVRQPHPTRPLTILEPYLERSDERSSTRELAKAKRESPGGVAPELQAAWDAYNEAAARAGWPECKRLPHERRAKLAERLREVGLDGWRQALARAEASSFLCGGGEKGFRASFDFLTSKSKFLKLLEGNYDNRPATGGSPGRRVAGGDGQGTSMASIVARRRLQGVH
jgi:biotin operon repressor